MLAEPSSDVKFEIGHVLFIDIVGYSKLLIHEQCEQIEKLRQIVRGTEQFRLAEEAGKLLRLPTGDGGALVFRSNLEAPVMCAIEISKELKNHSDLRVRMGIHSGPVNEITDLNEQANVAGAGINIAQRVMDCADAGHILVSKHVAEDLEHYARWGPCLQNLGECEVKHGVSISIFNLFSDEFGNPEPPQKFKERALGQKSAELAARISRKSIAVLPFENLSEDKANDYFAVGIQEEILTRLSKIGDLKVISRTSTSRFKSSPENVPEIARQLGVANILEGTVQKSRDQVRVNVQLIDAKNDCHIWAERYDRKLTDIFAVETDIASKIAESLHANLTGAERRAISVRPTKNSEAHQLYLRGRYLWNRFFAPGHEKSRDYFLQAIQADPCYALAYTGVALYYSFGAANGILPPADWPKAEEAVNKALSIDDNLADAYNPLAAVEIYCKRNWPAAERAFRRGAELNPNLAEIRHHYGLCLVLLGRNEEGLAQMTRAAELDPLFLGLNLHSGRMLFYTRQYDRAIDQFNKTLELHPGYVVAHEWLGDAYEKKGMDREAIGQWSKALVSSGESEDALTVQETYKASGFDAGVRELGRRRLERLNQRVDRDEYVPAAEYFMAYFRAGDNEQALAWLAKAVDEPNWFALEIKVNPINDRLRGDPRFQRLVDRVLPASK